MTTATTLGEVVEVYSIAWRGLGMVAVAIVAIWLIIRWRKKPN